MQQEKIIYSKLSHTITGLCFQVHNELGRFCEERQYADRLEQLFKENVINYLRETAIPFKIDEAEIAGNVAGFLIEDKIILDCKAKKFITKEDYFQM